MTLTTWAQRSIFVDRWEWLDRVNGNTYFSARVYVDGDEVARIPFQYGHGESQVAHLTMRALCALGIVTDSEGEHITRPLWNLRDECGIDVYHAQKDATKKAVRAHGDMGMKALTFANGVVFGEVAR